MGILPAAANSVGSYLVGTVAKNGQLSAHDLITKPRKAYVSLNIEPQHDFSDTASAVEAYREAFVVALNPFDQKVLEVADVILPITPFTETGGSYVNAQGDWQIFHPVTRPQGMSKPGWQALKLFANSLDIDSPCFHIDDLEKLRAQIEPLINDGKSQFSNAIRTSNQSSVDGGIKWSTRIAAYGSDAVVRRAASLQKTDWGKEAQFVSIAANVWQQIFGQETASNVDKAQEQPQIEVIIKQGNRQIRCHAIEKKSLAQNTIEIPLGSDLLMNMGNIYSSVFVERA